MQRGRPCLFIGLPVLIMHAAQQQPPPFFFFEELVFFEDSFLLVFLAELATLEAAPPMASPVSMTAVPAALAAVPAVPNADCPAS
mmetsp:Transcript_12442/g.29213  ORF Transcript_12442/g.29213 Transcript_12442/m.29213 type:complete len:85 (+) Transcript_12442:69-323(+)